MDKITFIVPIHEYNKNVKEYLTKAINSVKSFKSDSVYYSFVGPSDIFDNIKEFIKENGIENISNVYKNEDTDVYVQINQAVKFCLTPYFSVLEFDDTYNDYWLSEFEKYSKENSDASIYMPIVELVNTDNNVCGYVNEIAWASSFSADELGYLDLECLKAFMDFNVTGSIIKTEDFMSVGCLKPSLKIAAWYEFLMRLSNNGKNIYVVPKVGYNHLVGRDGSYTKTTAAEIDIDYGQWLIKTAQEEYKYPDEREIKYVKEEIKDN